MRELIYGYNVLFIFIYRYGVIYKEKTQRNFRKKKYCFTLETQLLFWIGRELGLITFQVKLCGKEVHWYVRSYVRLNEDINNATKRIKLKLDTYTVYIVKQKNILNVV